MKGRCIGLQQKALVLDTLVSHGLSVLLSMVLWLSTAAFTCQSATLYIPDAHGVQAMNPPPPLPLFS